MTEVNELDMFPRFQNNDVLNGRMVNIKYSGKFWHVCFAGGVQLADFYYLRFCQFCLGCLFAIGSQASSLVYHIYGILFLCASPQVIWVNAGAHVALVKCKQTFWNFSVMKFIAKSMGDKLSCSNAELSVTTFIQRAGPQPTIIWPALIYFLPESTFWGDTFRLVAANVLNRLSFYQSAFRVALCGKFSFPATTTHAQPAWVRLIGWAVSVTTVTSKKERWLSLFPVRFRVIFGNYIGFLAATTMAVPVRDFIFKHKNTSCRITEHALAEGGGRRQEAVRNYSPLRHFRQLTITLSALNYSISTAEMEVL